MKEKIKIEIEIGHWAKRISAVPTQPVLPNSAVQNATHVWKVWVCGRRGQLESFVERVVFQLHPTFPNPIRVVSRPPFEIEEKAFGTFPMKIELHFNDSMAGFEYEVFLMLDKDINCKSIKSFAIANPRPPEFREKLIQAGGVVVDPSEEALAGPAEVKLTKSGKQSSGTSSLSRHKSKSKSAAAHLTATMSDDQAFPSPASSSADELLLTGQAPSTGSLVSSLPQSPLSTMSGSDLTGARSIVGSRLASPSKAKLRESGVGFGQQQARPKAQSSALVVKSEPVLDAGGLPPPLPPPPPPPAVPRVAELRADDSKSEKLVLKISKSPVKSSPATVAPAAPPAQTVKSEAMFVETYSNSQSFSYSEQQQQQQHQMHSWSAPPQPQPSPAVAVVAPHVTVDAYNMLPAFHPQPQPQAQMQTVPSTESPSSSALPAPWQASVVSGAATESEDDRRRRKKEKRKKDKDRHHRHHRRRHRSRLTDDVASAGGASDSDEQRRHERRHRNWHHHQQSEHQSQDDTEDSVGSKRRRRDEERDFDIQHDAVLNPGGRPSTGDIGNNVGLVTVAPPPTAAAPPPVPLPPPPPMLEAEPPMLSPYLQSAVVAHKRDPELMSQTSVESTGFRPPTADRVSGASSTDSSPLAAASIPISAAAMAAEAAAAAAAASASTSSTTSVYARHPKYQWSAQTGLSREEYDKRFQLCLLAASLEDPARLERLAAVLADSEALTERDGEYAHFDLARLNPDCVRRLASLLMPDTAS